MSLNKDNKTEIVVLQIYFFCYKDVAILFLLTEVLQIYFVIIKELQFYILDAEKVRF